MSDTGDGSPSTTVTAGFPAGKAVYSIAVATGRCDPFYRFSIQTVVQTTTPMHQLKEAMMPDSREKQVSPEEAIQTPAEDELSHRVRRKWAADTHVIAAVLAELEQQLSLASLRLAFRDERPQGAAMAVGRITGSLAGMPIDLLLNVHPGGEIYPLRRDPKEDEKQVPSTSSSKMSVLTADKGQYETLILDLIGVE